MISEKQRRRLNGKHVTKDHVELGFNCGDREFHARGLHCVRYGNFKLYLTDEERGGFMHVGDVMVRISVRPDGTLGLDAEET